jgi:hypothetical protein
MGDGAGRRRYYCVVCGGGWGRRGRAGLRDEVVAEELQIQKHIAHNLKSKMVVISKVK